MRSSTDTEIHPEMLVRLNSWGIMAFFHDQTIPIANESDKSMCTKLPGQQTPDHFEVGDMSAGLLAT